MPGELTEDQLARREIIRRHAKLNEKTGTPKFCGAPRAEIAERAARGFKPLGTPVIYPDVDAALACAAELFSIDGRQQWAYVCPRSKRGHAHLSHHPPREQP